MSGNILVINVDIREIRVALIEDGILAELHIERLSSRSTLGNVYLGKVSRVLPGMQAAFIDIGEERAAFLHVEDLIRPADFEAYLSGAREDSPARNGDEEPAVEDEGGDEGGGGADERPRSEAPEEADDADGVEVEPTGSVEITVEVGDDEEIIPSRRSEPEEPVEHDSEDRDGEDRADSDDSGPDSDRATPDSDRPPPDSDRDEEPGGPDTDRERDSDEPPARDGADDPVNEEGVNEDGVNEDPENDDRVDEGWDEPRVTFGNAVLAAEQAPMAAAEIDAGSVDIGSVDAGSAGEPEEEDEDAGDGETGGDVRAEHARGDDTGEGGAEGDRPRGGRRRRRRARVARSAQASPDGAAPRVADRGPERDRGPDNRGPDNRGADNRGNRGPDNRGPDNRGPDNRGPDNRGPDNRGAGNRGPDNRGPDNRGPDNRGSGNRGPGDRGDRKRRDGRGRDGRDRDGRDRAGRDRDGRRNRDDRGRDGGGGRRQAKRGRTRETRQDRSRISKNTPIRDVVREGQQVIVQVTKEPIGSKGARVSSHVSLPGRYVVYLPTVEHIGISKRIGNDKERGRLRQVIESVKPPKGGLVVRTMAEGLTKKQLKNDIAYLVRLWDEIARKKEETQAAHGPTGPSQLYEELDLVLKTARDLFTEDVGRIIIDNREQYIRLRRFVEMFMPERAKDVHLYEGTEPVFDAYGIEDEIGRALSRKVPLQSGGHLIIDQAEALTAIDVNTGRFVGRGSKDLEDTILQTNLEAVEEIAYQLRFRNIGGLIILDLIDMERGGNREKVRRKLEALLAKDKAKTTLNRISELGLIEMTRKRTRESLGRQLHEPCFYCDGTGQLMSKETISYEILRQIRREQHNLKGYKITVNAHPAIVDLLKTEEREAVQEVERIFARRIDLVPRKEYHLEQFDLQGI